MQDRYAGDVGDFGKFGLLRHLCGETAQDKCRRNINYSYMIGYLS